MGRRAYVCDFKYDYVGKYDFLIEINIIGIMCPYI